jgi:hypothetical protein
MLALCLQTAKGMLSLGKDSYEVASVSMAVQAKLTDMVKDWVVDEVRPTPGVSCAGLRSRRHCLLVRSGDSTMLQ